MAGDNVGGSYDSRMAPAEIKFVEKSMEIFVNKETMRNFDARN
jgi:hypothetical protein